MFKWYAENGHLFSEEVKVKKNNDFRFGNNFESRIVIAYNIGQKTAEYIAKLHNEKIV